MPFRLKSNLRMNLQFRCRNFWSSVLYIYSYSFINIHTVFYRYKTMLIQIFKKSEVQFYTDSYSFLQLQNYANTNFKKFRSSVLYIFIQFFTYKLCKYKFKIILMNFKFIVACNNYRCFKIIVPFVTLYCYSAHLYVVFIVINYYSHYDKHLIRWGNEIKNHQIHRFLLDSNKI